MENILGKSILNICSLLQKHHVEYMLIGGTAVALHGYYRHSVTLSGEITEKPDIDIWYNPTYKNYFNVLEVMKGLDINIDEFKNEKTPNPLKSFFKLEFDNFTLDFIPTIKSDISFKEADSRKDSIVIENTTVYFMSYRDLVIDKESSSRKKDIEDLEHLRRIKKNNG